MTRPRYYYLFIRMLSSMTWIIKAYIKFTLIAFVVYFLFHVTFYTKSTKYDSSSWPTPERLEVKNLINPNERTVKLVPRNACNNDDRKLVLLIMVASHVKDREKRDIIRNTWAKNEFPFDKKFQLMFLLGHTVDTRLQTKVKEEYWKFGDILQESFLDTNATSTIKSLAMLKYFSQFCTQQAKYLLKVEDNVYINIPQLYHLIHENNRPIILTGTLYCEKSSLCHGNCIEKSPKPNGMSSSIYHSFLSNGSYLMSRMTAWILYNTALRTTIFQIENVYITGILPEIYNELSTKERRELTRIPVSLSGDKSTEILKKDIYPENDKRFNVEYLDNDDPCLHLNFISSSALSIYEMKQLHLATYELRKNNRNEKQLCFDRLISDKRQKSCNTRNTMLGGKNKCCGYIEYIWRNLAFI